MHESVERTPKMQIIRYVVHVTQQASSAIIAYSHRKLNESVHFMLTSF
jgi:hypothetical protein